MSTLKSEIIKKKILFLIHDLGQGGAEKVLVNLVNNMDRDKFDISVLSLFGGGVNEQFLKPDITYRAVFKWTFPANSKLMKLFTPKQLYKWFIKGHYDIIVSYLEGPSARIVSGCMDKNTKLVSWIHCTIKDEQEFSASFRNMSEAVSCYSRFDQTIFVSKGIQTAFIDYCPTIKQSCILYNTNESEAIKKNAKESVNEQISNKTVNIIGMGSLSPVKGFDRLIRIQKRLLDFGMLTHLYILGKGSEYGNLKKLADSLDIPDSVTFLGYQTNPYKYLSKCDLFVCSSLSEGFSTAATEALIVGTPVCTVEVSGMKEMLGENNEYGIITENNDEALYLGIFDLLTAPGKLEHYRKQAEFRGKQFSTSETVKAVEKMLLNL